MISLEGKTALVTGGGRGIGREIAVRLAGAGCDVGVCDIDQASAGETAALIEKEGYMLKLMVPHWIDLAAGRAYVEECALRLDRGEKDLQIEGSVAKLWCTERIAPGADSFFDNQLGPFEGLHTDK